MSKLIYLSLALAAAPPASEAAQHKSTQVIMRDTEGKNIGRATITDSTPGVTVTLNLHDLPPGEHALHFHQNAKCETPSFASAGDHLALQGEAHGANAAAGPHIGDLPNVTVGQDGKLKAKVKAEALTLDSERLNTLYKGAALVLHAQADDMQSQPSGNSGARIACGVVKY